MAKGRQPEVSFPARAETAAGGAVHIAYIQRIVEKGNITPAPAATVLKYPQKVNELRKFNKLCVTAVEWDEH